LLIYEPFCFCALVVGGTEVLVFNLPLLGLSVVIYEVSVPLVFTAKMQI